MIAATGIFARASRVTAELRDSTIPGAEKGTNMRAFVGGSTAGYDDLATKISAKLPLQIAVVIALSFLLLISPSAPWWFRRRRR